MLDYSVGLTFSYRGAAALRGVCVCVVGDCGNAAGLSPGRVTSGPGE